MRRNRILWIMILAFLGLAPSLKAQDFALKSNILSDAALTPNLGLEVGLAPKWTLDVSGQINAWPVKDRRWKHWLVQPEARYWFCRRFAGHFLGFHALGGQFNFGNWKHGFDFLGTDFSKLKDMRYQGWGAGAGVAYGYAWPVHPHWNIEAEIGLGWIYTRYDSYPCSECGSKVADNKAHNYVGPTKLALNIVYIF